jgi:ribonuclease HI
MKRLANPCGCDRLHIWCDGQVFRVSEPEARPTVWDGFCTVVRDDDDGPLGPGALMTYTPLGNKTISECEYSAVIFALNWGVEHETGVHAITDAGLILGHVESDWRCEPHLRQYRDRVVGLLALCPDNMLSWMGRDFNKAGWYNATVLLERARAKRLRDKEQGIVRPKKKKRVPGAPLRWAFQGRD